MENLRLTKKQIFNASKVEAKEMTRKKINQLIGLGFSLSKDEEIEIYKDFCCIIFEVEMIAKLKEIGYKNPRMINFNRSSLVYSFSHVNQNQKRETIEIK